MVSVTKFILALFFAQCLAAQNESTQAIEGPLEMLECSNVEVPGFTVVDYIVVLGVLVISLGIGIFYGYFTKAGSSSNEFLLGSEMSVFPVTLSLMTSFITAIELLGNPSEMYFHGTQFVLIVIPMVLVIPVAVKCFYPIYFKMEVTSCYEYLGIRFGKPIRILGAMLYIIQMSFYTAVAVLAPAIALSKVTGINTYLAIALIYIVCIFYSSQGGMKAVVITDTFLAGVLAVSLIVIIVFGYFYTGGFIDIFEQTASSNRLEFFNFDPNPTTRHTVFSVIIGGFFYWTSLFCTNQASVQKCMSLKSLKPAKIALGFAIVGLVIVFLMNFYTGLLVYTHYHDCDPYQSGKIDGTDQLLPFYIVNTYEKIYSIAGIFVAGIFAASLGTVASALNSLAAVTCEDILINGLKIEISPDQGATYAKWMSLGYGLLSFALVFIVEKLGGVLEATLTLNGLLGGVTLGLFALGLAFKRANGKGALWGGILSLLIVIYLGVMAQIYNTEAENLGLSVENCHCMYNRTTETSLDSDIHLLSLQEDEKLEELEKQASSWESIYKISYIWYTAIGCLLTIFLGLVISAIVDVCAKKSMEISDKKNEEVLGTKWDNNYLVAQFVNEAQLKSSEKVDSKEGIDNIAVIIED